MRDDNDNNIEQIEKLIEKLENELRELKLAVGRINEERTQATRTRNTSDPRDNQELEVGSTARITNNIGPFQEREGKVVKINRATGRVTIQGRRRKGKVVRALKNVIRIERYTEE